MCLTTYFKHFVFMELFDLNSNLNNLFESSSIKDFSANFLVDFLMCLCISFILLKILKSSSSGLILINVQPSYFSNAFVFVFQDKFYTPRHCIEFAYFLLQMHPLLILILTVL